MKIVCWVYFLSALCLIPLSGPCAAENSTSSPSFEASIAILPSGEAIPAPGTIEALEPSIAAEPSPSFDPTEAPISVEQDDGLVQTSVENTPPEPPQPEEAAETIADPIEPVNRAFFHFNDKLYFWVLKPIATGYKAIIPEDGRMGVHNFFSNVTTPIRLVNCLLQAKFKGAGNETVRFLLNTTLGIGWFFRPGEKRHSKLKNRMRILVKLWEFGESDRFSISIGPSWAHRVCVTLWAMLETFSLTLEPIYLRDRSSTLLGLLNL